MRSFETAGQGLTVKRRAVFAEVSHKPRNKTLGRCAAASRPRSTLRGLCSGERTGPSGFHELWSYVPSICFGSVHTGTNKNGKIGRLPRAFRKAGEIGKSPLSPE